MARSAVHSRTRKAGGAGTEEVRRLNIEAPIDLLDALKIHAAKHRMKIRDVVISALEDYLGDDYQANRAVKPAAEVKQEKKASKPKKPAGPAAESTTGEEDQAAALWGDL